MKIVNTSKVVSSLIEEKFDNELHEDMYIYFICHDRGTSLWALESIVNRRLLTVDDVWSEVLKDYPRQRCPSPKFYEFSAEVFGVAVSSGNKTDEVTLGLDVPADAIMPKTGTKVKITWEEYGRD